MKKALSQKFSVDFIYRFIWFCQKVSRCAVDTKDWAPVWWHYAVHCLQSKLLSDRFLHVYWLYFCYDFWYYFYATQPTMNNNQNVCFVWKSAVPSIRRHSTQAKDIERTNEQTCMYRIDYYSIWLSIPFSLASYSTLDPDWRNLSSETLALFHLIIVDLRCFISAAPSSGKVNKNTHGEMESKFWFYIGIKFASDRASDEN